MAGAYDGSGGHASHFRTSHQCHRPVRKWRAAESSRRYLEPRNERLRTLRRVSMSYVSKQVRSPVGLLTLVASERGLAAILWPEDPPGRVRLDVVEAAPDHPVLRKAE